MSEQRLIDANKVEIGFDELCQSPYFKSDVNAKNGAETLMDLCVRTDSHKQNTIDPETLPIVQELRKQVKDLQEQLFHLEYWGLDRKLVLESAAQDRAAVNVMRKRCEKIIAELRAELKRITEERDAAIDELGGVLGTVDALTEFVDDEIYPVVNYDLYLQLRDKVDVVAKWEHKDKWCPDKKEENK